MEVDGEWEAVGTTVSQFSGGDGMKERESMTVQAVGCQVGSRTEGERSEASGKGTRSSSYEPLAPNLPKAVIQFTGGTL